MQFPPEVNLLILGHLKSIKDIVSYSRVSKEAKDFVAFHSRSLQRYHNIPENTKRFVDIYDVFGRGEVSAPFLPSGEITGKVIGKVTVQETKVSTVEFKNGVKHGKFRYESEYDDFSGYMTTIRGYYRRGKLHGLLRWEVHDERGYFDSCEIVHDHGKLRTYCERYMNGDVKLMDDFYYKTYRRKVKGKRYRFKQIGWFSEGGEEMVWEPIQTFQRLSHMRDCRKILGYGVEGGDLVWNSSYRNYSTTNFCGKSTHRYSHASHEIGNDEWMPLSDLGGSSEDEFEKGSWEEEYMGYGGHSEEGGDGYWEE